jgi:hypothetical protein
MLILGKELDTLQQGVLFAMVLLLVIYVLDSFKENFTVEESRLLNSSSRDTRYDFVRQFMLNTTSEEQQQKIKQGTQRDRNTLLRDMRILSGVRSATLDNGPANEDVRCGVAKQFVNTAINRVQTDVNRKRAVQNPHQPLQALLTNLSPYESDVLYSQLRKSQGGNADPIHHHVYTAYSKTLQENERDAFLQQSDTNKLNIIKEKNNVSDNRLCAP